MVERRRIHTATEGGNYFTTPKRAMFFSSGSKLLDLAMGGGWAENRIANVLGNTSTGKTLLCIEAAANFAMKYPQGKIRYRETEAAFDKDYAGALGMPLDRVDFGDEPTLTIEDFYEELKFISDHSTKPELIIVDSLDALSTRAELARNIDEATYATEKAKMMSALFRRINQVMSNKHITMIIVSQIRDNITKLPYAKKFKRSGGKAMDFYPSQVVRLTQLKRVVKTVQKITLPIGILIKAELDKNKVGIAFRGAEFPIMFGYGIEDRGSCIEWLKKIGEELPSKNAPLSVVHYKVERKWYEIEKSFLPTKRKYGPLSQAAE